MPEDKSLKGGTDRPNSWSAPTVSLPKGGGAIRGIGEKFTANPATGTGSLSVPVALSPGRGGFGPQLTLSYDSGSGNGPFGFGWRLGLPSISRKTDRGLPTYDDARESDIFLLSGAEDLVPILVESGAWSRETPQVQLIGTLEYRVYGYRPRIEGLFARIERWSSTDGRDTFWRSISRENVTTFYGRTADSRIVDPEDATKVFSWLICETYDDKGNVTLFEYQRENRDGIDETLAHERNRKTTGALANVYLKRIKYGNTPSRLAPTYTAPAGPIWHFEAVFDYGEGHYREIAQNPPDPDYRVFAAATPASPAGAQWAVRPDPFSSYRAGFEVRTYRRCQRVLMFHRFAELGPEPVLVRSTDFEYSGGPFSFLNSVTHAGYVDFPGRGLLKRTFPPVTFRYSPTPSATDLADCPILEVAGDSLKNLPVGLGDGYQWVDLDGEGVAGVLCETPGAWYYKRNLGDARFGPTETVATLPSIVGRRTHRLLDLAGDGQLDVVAVESGFTGLMERTGDGGWETFRPLTSTPNISWQDPNVRLFDLTGDGLTDLVLSEQDAFLWHRSLGEDGFGPAQRARKLLDEEKGPQLVFADGTETIFLADMSGDGLTDLVRIRNGDVCYWPNLGYGRFGAKVTMDQAPWFDHPDRFDPRRARLADLDGSGVADLVYLHPDAAVLYFNRSGNGWSDGQRLPQFPPVDDLSTVQVVDLLGKGTACIVWSSPLPEDSTRPFRYIDLMRGTKPHLLLQVDNNLGAKSTVEYASSTRFYLEDRAAGQPWITRLPFPVHVVTRVTVEDQWRGTRFSSRYSYHHGHFDGVEREFRGFGRVEQIDVEDYGTFLAGNTASPYITTDFELYQPPVKTITWYHTGADIDRRRILSQFESEYFPARFPNQTGFTEKPLPEPDLGAEDLSAEEWREALRACKGMILRQEVYELDVDALAARPPTHVPVRIFSAATHNCQIRRLQPQRNNRHAVFLVTESEAIAYQHDLDLAPASLDPDPRITHTVTLRRDELGNPQQAFTIAYGRRPAQADSFVANLPVSPAQRALIRGAQVDGPHIAYTETRYTNDAIEPPGVIEQVLAAPASPIDHHRRRVPCEVLTYELTGIDPSGDGYITRDRLQRLILSSTFPPPPAPPPPAPPNEPVVPLEYHEPPDPARGDGTPRGAAAGPARAKSVSSR